MQSVQESKQELEAAIRYAENAISSAKTTIESMEFRQEMAKKQYAEQTGREEALTKQVRELESKVQGQYDDIVVLERRLEEVKTNMALMTDENERLKAEVNALEQPERPTMPVIPKAVAIAIFREGLVYGGSKVCDEIENAPEICIEESEYCGGFEVSFTQDVDLSDHLDLDYLRESAGSCDESTIIGALYCLCADNEFECRIHGIDDQEEKNAD